MKYLRKLAKMFTMALVFSMIGIFGVLPTNPSASSASVGKDFLLYINTGTAGLPTWTLVGGQRGSSLGRTADSIDLSNKTTSGWKSIKAGLRGWSIDLDSLVVLQDAGMQALEEAFMGGLEINIKLEYPNGTIQTGWGSLTDFSMETPHDGEASLKGTIEGNGALSSRAPGITPLSASMSKAAAADKVFTIAPSTETVSSVTDDGSALTITTHYTYSGGTLTIKGSAYLASVAVGVHTIEVTTGSGAKLRVLITITA